MSNVGRKLSAIRMHTTTHLEGYGNFGPSIDIKNSSKSLGALTLVRAEDGVEVYYKAKDGKPVEAFIPNGNLISAQYLVE